MTIVLVGLNNLFSERRCAGGPCPENPWPGRIQQAAGHTPAKMDFLTLVVIRKKYIFSRCVGQEAAVFTLSYPGSGL